MNSAVKEDMVDDHEGNDGENRLNSDLKQDAMNNKSLDTYKEIDKEDIDILIAVGKKFSSFEDLKYIIWRRKPALLKQQKSMLVAI